MQISRGFLLLLQWPDNPLRSQTLTHYFILICTADLWGFSIRCRDWPARLLCCLSGQLSADRQSSHQKLYTLSLISALYWRLLYWQISLLHSKHHHSCWMHNWKSSKSHPWVLLQVSRKQSDRSLLTYLAYLLTVLQERLMKICYMYFYHEFQTSYWTFVA